MVAVSFYRVLIGAPEAQSGQPSVVRGGVVYRCDISEDNRCQAVPFDRNGKFYYICQVLFIYVALLFYAMGYYEIEMLLKSGNFKTIGKLIKSVVQIIWGKTFWNLV